MNDETPKIEKPPARKLRSVLPKSSELPLHRPVFTWIFLIGSAALTLVLGGLILFELIIGSSEEQTINEHFAAVVGLPFAAVASLFIVLVCDVRGHEKMKFQALGFKFEGASSQVVLWVLCFLIMTLAIKLLWGSR
jgi:hypothetical protein